MMDVWMFLISPDQQPRPTVLSDSPDVRSNDVMLSCDVSSSPKSDNGVKDGGEIREHSSTMAYDTVCAWNTDKTNTCCLVSYSSYHSASIVYEMRNILFNAWV